MVAKSQIIKTKNELSENVLLHVSDNSTLYGSSINFKYLEDNLPFVMGYWNYFCDGLYDKTIVNISNIELVHIFLKRLDVYVSVMPNDDDWFVTIFVNDNINELAYTGFTGEYQFIDKGCYDDMVMVSYINGLIIMNEIFEYMSNNIDNKSTASIIEKIKNNLKI